MAGIDFILCSVDEKNKESLSKKKFVFAHSPCQDILEEWCGFDRCHEVRAEARTLSTASYTCV